MKQHYFLLIVDQFLDFSNQPPIENLHLILPQDFHLTGIVNSGQLLSKTQVIAFIKSFGGQPIIIPFKPSAKLELICQKNNFILAANPAKTNRFLEDKIKFFLFCQKHHLPTIPAQIVSLNQVNFSTAQKILNSSKLVIQTHFGWAGQSTFYADNWHDISQKIAIDTIVKISPFHSGYTLTTNNCWYQETLLQSPPALQLTGIPSLTKNQFSTVGRQWPSFAPSNVIEQVNLITKNFANIIKDEYNYRGFFGLDYFVNQNSEVIILECNPRLTASYDFYTKLEYQAGLVPLFLYHLDEFTTTKHLKLTENRFNNTNIIGTEITPKNDQGKTIKKIHLFTPITQNPNNIKLPPMVTN